MLFLGAIALGGSFLWPQKQGFSPAKIGFAFPDKYVNGPEVNGLEPIFSQSYSYLASGSQSYAFVSQDGRYVTKFFRMHHLTPRWYDVFRPTKAVKKCQSLQKVFGAYQLAYDKMREDAGLLYLHLHPTSHLQKKLNMIDKKGREHSIELDEVPFVIQERAELIFSRLQRLLQTESRQALQSAVDAVKNLIQRRAQKGIFDRDQGVTNNFGFVGDRVIQIDIGRLYQADSGPDENQISDRLHDWLVKIDFNSSN